MHQRCIVLPSSAHTSGLRLAIRHRRRDHQKHQIDQTGVRDRMLDARGQENDIVPGTGSTRDPSALAFQYVIDLLLHPVLVARHGHRLVHRAR
jgi:hypothetical protein